MIRLWHEANNANCLFFEQWPHIKQPLRYYQAAIRIEKHRLSL